MYAHNPYGYGTPLVGVDLTLQSLPLTTQNINAIFNQKVSDILGEISVFNADGSRNTNFSNQLKEKIAFEKVFQQRKDAILKPVADLIIATGQNQGKGMDQTGSFTGFQSRQGYAHLYDDGRTKVSYLAPDHDIDASQGSATTGQTTSLAPTGQELLAQFDQFFQIDELTNATVSEIEQGLATTGVMLSNIYYNTPDPFKPPMRAKIIDLLNAVQNKLGKPLVLDNNSPAEIRAEWNASQPVQQVSSDQRTGATAPVTQNEIVVVSPIGMFIEKLKADRQQAQLFAASARMKPPTALEIKARALANFENLKAIKASIETGIYPDTVKVYSPSKANPVLDLDNGDQAFLISLEKEIARFSVEPEIEKKTVAVASIKSKKNMADEIPMYAAQAAIGALAGKALADKPLVGAVVAPILIFGINMLRK